jgi:hypothetical protein
MRGSLLVRSGADLHLVWAALSLSGVYFDQRCAFHLHAIHEQPQVAAEGEAN